MKYLQFDLFRLPQPSGGSMRQRCFSAFSRHFILIIRVGRSTECTYIIIIYQWYTYYLLTATSVWVGNYPAIIQCYFKFRYSLLIIINIDNVRNILLVLILLKIRYLKYNNILNAQSYFHKIVPSKVFYRHSVYLFFILRFHFLKPIPVTLESISIFPSTS